MKKLLILCLLAMLSIPLIYAQCTDIDGGVTCNNQFYNDYCESTPTGGQYANIRICKNVTYQDCALLVGANRVLCPYGCKDGVCIQQTTTCTDSDGGKNYNTKGTAIAGSSKNEDVCVSDYQLKSAVLYEAYCDNSGVIQTEVYKCPVACVNGACTNIDTPCSDSDGGQNYDVKGTCRGRPNIYTDESENLTERCMASRESTSYNLIEYACGTVENKIICKPIFYNCPNGCKDGACIQQIRVISPNGGETFSDNQIVPIKTEIFSNKIGSIRIILVEEFSGSVYEVGTVYNISMSAINYYYYVDLDLSKLKSMGYIPAPGAYRAIVQWNSNDLTEKWDDKSDDYFKISYIQQTCTDSDSGKDYYTKGTTKGLDSQGNPIVEEDNCGFTVSGSNQIDYNYVNEFYCSGSVVYGTQYECPNGCREGACIQIVSCNNNSVCDYEEHSMSVGSSATYKGSTIKLENVGSQGGVVVDVNGVKETLVVLIPEVVNGVPIKVKTATYNPAKEGRSAVLTFGENSYLCGDCPNNPECFDSDNGQSYYEAGTVIERSQYKKWEPNIFSDMCSTDSPNGNLAEAVCKQSSDGYYYGSQVFFECLLGCKDGVCLTNETTCASVADDCCFPEDDMVCDPDCSTGEDPDCVGCTSEAGDCCLSESDGICDADCQTGEDPDCKEIGCNNDGVCELSRKENSDNCPEDCYCGDEICDSLENYKDCPEDCGYCTPEWECHLEPATCPEEGIQNKVCIDIKCGTEDKRVEVLKCIPGTCSGCLAERICYPVTTRMLLDETPSYCDVTKTFAKQKELGELCQNNYECKSNECSDGECISIKKQLEETRSLLQQILDWIKNIF